jgi:DNA-binding response OmpR family regulator
LGAGCVSKSRSNDRPRILIIDDEVLLACSLAKYLTYKGFNVKATSSPETALSMLEKERFDTVITDLRMIPVSGIEIVRYLRRSGFEGKIAVMSAYFNEFEKDLQELKVDGILEKPIELNSLLEIIMEDNAAYELF